MRFTAKVRENHQITVPKEIREAYDINRTDFIELELIRVKKV
ncbi:unnamed protein product [marine sediment metagenome]|uniref:SpoVT-AbrB domain-containing protein n=1 Tax=marine sediment metagenome TaxID=412755 RepID=X1AMP6_9ZZZZ